ncbi:hypothetical protein COCSUDRAFT_63046 [Coccomyxa subellipsoidea C-169]|uniref:Uncharacterized protein n=1 Tax=Coccomyxa subellipsoidea (strain C-169) TaxID=574566 RepID=I0YYP1_COCSC|nr:hypothetical protein COCSUDRAFT_63046 [Coccomyxa subellipsoidea C-169]EIE23510.1 hypothetical protein COCSUDRAFT_63046 [Coccomyxa subellipsoidea C-169]|eukprot:XP_005648054.1 hypothetical protein COCSUDRAFT_63046 [Coccomyxa subellipsoidea C-169]
MKTFDASQQDPSQHDAAEAPEQQDPTLAAPDEPRPGSPLMPASPPAQHSSDLEPDSPPRPQKRRARGKTAEERAEAAAAKEVEKQEKKAARERAKQEKAAQKEEEKQRKAQERLDRQRENGKSALEDILPVLCPAAMNHATTLRIMERLIADEYRYEVNLGGPLPLGPALRSLTWKRRVYRRSADGEASQARPASPANNISQHPS